jgi:hypothetical protein
MLLKLTPRTWWSKVALINTYYLVWTASCNDLTYYSISQSYKTFLG